MLDAILAQSRNTALIMGLVALIGLLLQKKSAVDTISGTVKTVIGFMVFNIGSNAMSAVVLVLQVLPLRLSLQLLWLWILTEPRLLWYLLSDLS